MIRETDIEAYFTRQAFLHLNAEVYKLVSPGRVGFPDRGLYWKGKRGKRQHCLVELKRPGVKNPRERQRVEHDRLEAKGAQVFVCNTKEGVDKLMEELRTW